MFESRRSLVSNAAPHRLRTAHPGYSGPEVSLRRASDARPGARTKAMRRSDLGLSETDYEDTGPKQRLSGSVPRAAGRSSRRPDPTNPCRAVTSSWLDEPVLSSVERVSDSAHQQRQPLGHQPVGEVAPTALHR